MVMESAVIGAVLASLMPWSSYQGLLALMTVVTVADPVPPPVTEIEIGIECDSVPLVPVIVALIGPTVAAADALIVRLLVAPADAGLNVAVTPLGSGLMLSATLPVNPPLGVIVTVLAGAVVPCASETLAGETKSEKSGVGTEFTVNVIGML